MGQSSAEWLISSLVEKLLVARRDNAASRAEAAMSSALIAQIGENSRCVCWAPTSGGATAKELGVRVSENRLAHELHLTQCG